LILFIYLSDIKIDTLFFIYLIYKHEIKVHQ